jgi:uncharacterized membrane protein YdbT with pleckstrin-like domain
MSYIERSLGEGERVIAVARYHWLYLFVAFLALIVLGIVLIGIWIFAVMMIRYHTTEIGVTTHRFIMKTGWIARDTQEIALDNIEGVQVHQTVWGRIFGYGELIVQGTGVDAVHLPKMLDDPVGFRRAIESARGDRSPPT